MSKQLVVADGDKHLRLAWRVWGGPGRPALVCLHGAYGTGAVWAPFATHWMTEYLLVAPDLRGHGDSDWSAEGYDLEAFADDLEALRAHLELPQFRLLGLSLGGLVAMAYAGRHPARLAALSIVDIAPALGPAAARDVLLSDPYPERFESLAAAVAWAAQSGLWGDGPGLHADLAERLSAQPDGTWRWRADPRMWSRTQRRRWFEAEDLWADFARIACPVQLVRGGRSNLVDAPTLARMRAVQPDLRVVTIDAAGHSVPRDAPTAFAQAVGGFRR